MYSKAGKWAWPACTWENLGGEISGPITALASENGSVDLFALSRDGSLRHQTWSGQLRKSSTSGWENLGGELRGTIAVVRSPAGRFDIFALGRGGAVYQKTRND